MRAISSSLTGIGTSVPQGWRQPLIQLGTVWAALLALFASDWAAMAMQWWDTSTYNHILLVVPILGWQVWSRWPQLRQLEPRVWWPGLLPFAGGAVLWMLGAMSGLDLARQAGAVAMLGAAVPLLLGVRVAAGLAFPLGYLVFLVPVGEELVEVLQTITAQIAIGLTHLSGVPAVVDGVFIDTPVGLFEVAEACSGVKFLIAMIAFGALAANVCFVGWRRRMAMMAACLVVPIVANGIRAWGTIYAAQFFGVKVAAGIDHIIYGWIFFAVILGLVIAGAWRFFDRSIDAPMVDVEAIGRSSWLARLERSAIPAGKALLLVALVLAAVRGWAFTAEQLEAEMPAQIALPDVQGWKRVDYAPGIWWEPKAAGAQHRLLGRYEDSEGHRVDVFVALYSRQGDGYEAGGFGQGALMPDTAWSWQSPGPELGTARSERLLGGGTVERLALTWYRNGSLFSGSNAQLKLAVVANNLLFRARPTSTLILSAEGGKGAPAEVVIRKFAASTGPLDSWIDRIVGVR